MLAKIIAAAAMLLAIWISPSVVPASAQFDRPIIILKSSFVDSTGHLNVVGTVRNYAQAPVEVTVGLTTSGGPVQTGTFGKVIWPLTDSPFKFVLPDNVSQAGDPEIVGVSELKAARADGLVLSYDGMAVGEERAFVGKVKNNGDFAVANVSVFAAVHNSNHTRQLDSVRSDVIPLIKPGEEVSFTAIPDLAVRSDILYYSCAGLNFDEPVTTVKVGENQIMAYDLSAAAQVSQFRYENTTDSIAFAIRPYGPSGGPMTLRLPQTAMNQTVSVLLDGNLNDASVKKDGRTLSIDLFVPAGDHEVQVQGIRNVPEMPVAVFVLAGLIGGVACLRFVKPASEF